MVTYLNNEYTKKFTLMVLFLLAAANMQISAAEHTILIGPKTIGRGWRDNIVLEARHFQHVKAGDILTVYNDNAKGNAQGAFQNPKDWQAVAPEYAYFNVKGPFRLTFTDEILTKVREHGLGIGGHDYRITQVTITPGEEFVEKIVWRGPSLQMKSDWSVSAAITGQCFKNLKLGDGIRFHASRVEPEAAAKLMDMTYNALDPSTNGIPVGSEGFTFYVEDQAPLLKIQLAGTGQNVALRVGGKGYRLDKIGIVQFIGEVDEDFSDAQHAPKEYILQPGELYRGEKLLPADWSGNLIINAAPFQECTTDDCLIISYTLLNEDCPHKISLRENRGNWDDLGGASEPQWLDLNGQDLVIPFDEISLDRLKTKGFVLTGVGCVVTRIQLITVQ